MTPLGGRQGRCRRGCVSPLAPGPTLSLSLCPPGLKLPTSSADTRFNVDDSEGPELEQDTEERCCPCHRDGGQLPMEGEAVSFQKKFENFLHNSIIIPRYLGGA